MTVFTVQTPQVSICRATVVTTMIHTFQSVREDLWILSDDEYGETTLGTHTEQVIGTRVAEKLYSYIPTLSVCLLST